MKGTHNQKIKTPDLVLCICGEIPECVISPYDTYDYTFRVECKCGKFWPKLADTRHRAICSWNTHITKLNNITNIEK